MNRGFIKIWRSSVENPLYFAEPFTKWQAWIDLLMLANYTDRSVSIRGILVSVNRGQVLAGEDFLATRWKWSRGKVRRFMEHLSSKTVQQIVQQKDNVCGIITICDYATYQDNGTASSTTDSTADSTASSTTDGQQTVQQTDTPKKDKNDKNEEKNTSCAEPPSVSPPKEPALLTFPCTGAEREWNLTESKLAEWKLTFETIDVFSEIKKARQWILDNPSKRKTANGMTSFIGSWLSRAVSRPSRIEVEPKKPERPVFRGF